MVLGSNKKTKSLLLHKSDIKCSIPSPLPTLKLKNHYFERINPMKCLGVLLDEHLSSKEHTKYIENKIAKNKGIMYTAKPLLDEETLLVLYDSHITHV